MKKKIVAAVSTMLLGIVLALNTFALTDEESVQRKQAYYPCVESVVKLLSDNTSHLSNISVKRIIVESSKDFTTAEAVKENVQNESRKFITLSTIGVSVQFSAVDDSSPQEYVFTHYMAAGSTYDLVLASSSTMTVYNYDSSVKYLNDFGLTIGNGVAYTMGDYYLDIDLSDYQNSGYTLTLPIVKPADVSDAASSTDSTLPSTEPTSSASISAPQVAQTESSSPEVASASPSQSAKTATTTSSGNSSSSSHSTPKAATSAYKKVGIMVWIPTNGGKRYHNSSSCSGMINPRKVDLGEAKYLGFTACGRCYR